MCVKSLTMLKMRMGCMKVSNIVNEHAPRKTKVVKTHCVPYMNEQLRKSINVRNMFRRKYDRITNRQTWEAYRKKRNKVITLRKQSKRKYLMDKCGGKCTNSKDFWKIVKPLISHRNHGSGSDIILLENGDVINEQTQACDVLNQYYTSVNCSGNSVLLESIDDQSDFANIVEDFNHHPSVTYIKKLLVG